MLRVLCNVEARIWTGFRKPICDKHTSPYQNQCKMNSSKLTHRPLPAQATNLQPRAVQVRSPCRPTNEILGALLHDAASRCTPLLLAGLVSLSTPSLAALAAEDSSSSGSGTGVLRGFAQFYRSRQQSNGGQLFLGPIQLSRQRLEAALGALRSKESEDVYDAALTSLRSASMQCHGPDLTSATFQEYKLGDPCKLRLVVKNATTLTKDAALVTEAETLVSKIVR